MATSKSASVLYHLSGHVTDIRNQPLNGLLVRAYDRDMRSEEFIGEAVTMRKGEYNIYYDPSKFLKQEKKYPDLVVRVYSGDGKKLLFEPSIDGIRYNARIQESVNIRLKKLLPGTKDEFTRYVNTMKPLIGKVTFHDLKEDDEHQDISFLYREASIKKDHLVMLVLAHRLETSYELPVLVGYALLRMESYMNRGDLLRVRPGVGLDDDLKLLIYDLALIDDKQVSADVEKAVKRNVVPGKASKEVKAAIKVLEKYRKDAEKHDAGERPGKILELISDFILNDKIGLVKKAWADSNGDLEAFARLAQKNKVFEKTEHKQGAEASLILGSFLGYNKDLTDEVRKAGGIKKPEDLRKLAAMDSGQVNELLGKIKTPKSITKKIARFHVNRMMRGVEERYPAEVFVKNLVGDSKTSRHSKELISFLKREKDFDLANTRVDRYFRDKKLSAKNADSLKLELKRHQRMAKLGLSYDQSMKLYDYKIHSAQRIVGIGKGRFINEIAPSAGMTESRATEIFRRAEETHTAALMIASDLAGLHEASEIPALGGESVAMALTAAGEDFPTLKTLFQLTDMCECEHCRSVYSPAAYLVELLQFLDKRLVMDTTTDPPTTGTVAKNALFARRPGLGDLDLSCDNANVPVPYIDLVSELLEELISPDPGLDFTGNVTAGSPTATFLAALQLEFSVTDKAQIFPPDVNGDFILRDKNIVLKIHNTGGNNWNVKELHQTYGTAEELAARPYYLNEAAYMLLKTSNYAFDLPYDNDHTEASAIFDRFNIARADLMKAFQAALLPTDLDIAA